MSITDQMFWLVNMKIHAEHILIMNSQVNLITKCSFRNKENIKKVITLLGNSLAEVYQRNLG